MDDINNTEAKSPDSEDDVEAKTIAATVNNGDHNEIDRSEGNLLVTQMATHSNNPTVPVSPNHFLLDEIVPATQTRQPPPPPPWQFIYRYCYNRPAPFGEVRPLPTLQELIMDERAFHATSRIPNGLSAPFPSLNCQCSMCTELVRDIWNSLIEEISLLWQDMYTVREAMRVKRHEAWLAIERRRLENALEVWVRSLESISAEAGSTVADAENSYDWVDEDDDESEVDWDDDVIAEDEA